LDAFFVDAMVRQLVALNALVVVEGGFNFVTIGDWGGAALGSYHKTAADQVAAQMGTTAAANDAKFVLNTGDNFYYCGIQNTSDYQIGVDYTSVYTAQSLQVQWYSILGNHEYGYNVEAQLQLSKEDVTNRWVMPARYYTERIQISASQYMSMLMLDTSPCVKAYRSSSKSGWDPCGSDFPTCSPIEEGTCHFHENILTQDCSTQFAWFKQQLANVPSDDWLVVVGHHPLDEVDVEDFTSELQKHGFDVYLNGHAHTLQQYTIDGQGAYITSGAGSMVKTADQDNDERCATELQDGASATSSSGHSYQSVWQSKTAGFTLHRFSDDFSSLTNDFVSYEGKVIHSFTVKKQTAAVV